MCGSENTLEGIVRFDALHDEYHQFDPKLQTLMGEETGRTYRLGQQVPACQAWSPCASAPAARRFRARLNAFPTQLLGALVYRVECGAQSRVGGTLYTPWRRIAAPVFRNAEGES